MWPPDENKQEKKVAIQIYHHCSGVHVMLVVKGSKHAAVSRCLFCACRSKSIFIAPVEGQEILTNFNLKKWYSLIIFPDLGFDFKKYPYFNTGYLTKATLRIIFQNFLLLFFSMSWTKVELLINWLKIRFFFSNWCVLNLSWPLGLTVIEYAD